MEPLRSENEEVPKYSRETVNAGAGIDAVLEALELVDSYIPSYENSSSDPESYSGRLRGILGTIDREALRTLRDEIDGEIERVRVARKERGLE